MLMKDCMAHEDNSSIHSKVTAILFLHWIAINLGEVNEEL